MGYFITIIVCRDFAQTPLMSLWVDNGDFVLAKKQDASDETWSNLNQHDKQFTSNYTMNLVTYHKFVGAINIEFFEEGSRVSRDLFRSRTRPRRHYRWPPRARFREIICMYAADNTPAHLLYNKAPCIPYPGTMHLAAG